MEKDYSNSDAFARDIPFSRAVKAGKRVYYVDAKRSRGGRFYLSLTESKKVVTDEGEDNAKVTFEKHKLFIYPEDFANVMQALQEAVAFIEEQQGKVEERPLPDDFSIDIEF